ncbi:histone-lysine N-methyltransferase SETDB1-like isoform X2 [Acanthaster planci]|uniref:Histone-lysine N-methyltransferase SETDB1-like isoform X2 n=1 Tax=Acanthaster planci TaxID=133434 RepID=A0A8B7ZGR5_ACAPL|nr:histone-lysine N-methyltransferase SETDB1-like isoform X2 [Acanthaster planci]
MDESCHWNDHELPAQVEAILSEVWIKLDVDKQLQQAQEKIDEINNGHSEIGEIFDSVEQGLIDIDSELHPTDANGERSRFYADIADSISKLKNDLQDFHLKIAELGTCKDDTNDGQNSENGVVYTCMYSDDSTSQPPSPKCPSDREPEVINSTSEIEKVSRSDANRQQAGSDQQVILSEDVNPRDSVTPSNEHAGSAVSSTLTTCTSEDIVEVIAVSSLTRPTSHQHTPVKEQEVTAKHVKPVEKPSGNTHSKQPSQGPSLPEPGSKALRNVKASTSKPHDEVDVIDLCDGDDITPMEDDQDDVIECIQKNPSYHIQDSSVKLTQGTRVLAKKGSTWNNATIVNIIKDNNGQQKFKLKFDNKGGTVVSGKHISIHSYPPPSRVHVGSRVVAEYETGGRTPHTSLYAGIVAEVPLHINKARYLIFFDDGFAQYLGLKKIHLIHEVSNNVWEDVPEDNREFIQEYLEKYPERPMVRLYRDNWVKTEWNGVWWRAKVAEVDCSLVNMNFPNDGRNEWIYRGSPRLEPLHRELETAKYLRESGRLIAGSSVSKKRGGPRVEYLRVNPDYLVPESDVLALAEGKISLSKPTTSGSCSHSKGVFTIRTVDRMPVVQWAVTMLRNWCESHNVSAKFEDLSDVKLAELLERVYREGPRVKPEVYTTYTLQALRCALSTFLTEPPISRRVDIHRDHTFAKANQALTDSITAQSQDNSSNKKMVAGQLGISRRDLVKLLKSGLVCLSNPLGLLRLVWLFMQPFIGRAEGKIKSLDLDLLQKKDVINKLAESGLPYYEINSPVLGLSGGHELKIYATGNRFYCPHDAISKYISKLNPECPEFLQQPRIRSNFKMEMIWFDPRPMNSSSINTMMTDIGAAAKLSRQYNNADIRATSWDSLQEAIQDFTENLRMGYWRKPPPSQVKKTPVVTTTTTTATGGAEGKLVGQQIAHGKVNKPFSQQPAVCVKPNIQQGNANKVVRNLYKESASSKQSTAQTDSDDDVIILGTTSSSLTSKGTSKLTSSERLMQIGRMNIHRTDKAERQQTAKKSTSSLSHHHHHKHRHGSHRHNLQAYDSLKASMQETPRHMQQSRAEIKHTKMTFVSHQCSQRCVLGLIPDEKRKQKIRKQNPLHVPSMYGWVRRQAKQRGTGRRHVIYRAPCGRSLRTISEVDRYLTETKMEEICVDAFTFDPFVYTELCKYRISQRPFLQINDISKGAEPVPVSLVNEIDNEQPPDVRYIAHRQPEKGSVIITDPEFLICCDCTDNCKDNTKCACRMLTQKSAEDFPELIKNSSETGYKFRRLYSMVPTGIYECNSKCTCNKQCHNRVAQNGLSLRLQVFKTDRRGWGLRCLDDISQGAFVCTYAGQLWGAEEANRRGQEYGDEYFAELDHIEVVENSKEGYESDPMEDEGISDSKESLSTNSSDSDQCLTSDEDYHIGSDESETSSIAVDVENDSDYSDDLAKVQSSDSTVTKMVFRRHQFESGSGNMVEGSCWSVAFPEKDSSQSKVEAWVKSNNLSVSNDCLKASAEEGGIDEATAKIDKDSLDIKIQKRGLSDSLMDFTDRSSRDFASDVGYKPVAKKSVGSKRDQVAVKRGGRRDSSNKETDSSTSSIIKYGYNTSPGKVLDKSQIDAFKKRTHTSRLHMRRKSKEASSELTKTASVLSEEDTSGSEYSSIADNKAAKIDSESGTPCMTEHVEAQPTVNTTSTMTGTGNGKDTEKKTLPIRTRSFFGETSGHVMDAKFIGNLGRYLNHSCSPNLFVQNVFVDSHDLRFPWVAFFAKKYVRAGSELTWDYNYDVGSVPGKSLICLCGSHECRGRLL